MQGATEFFQRTRRWASWEWPGWDENLQIISKLQIIWFRFFFFNSQDHSWDQCKPAKKLFRGDGGLRFLTWIWLEILCFTTPFILCIPILFHFMYKQVYIPHLKGVYLALRCRKINGLRDGSMRFQIFFAKVCFHPWWHRFWTSRVIITMHEPEWFLVTYADSAMRFRALRDTVTHRHSADRTHIQMGPILYPTSLMQN